MANCQSLDIPARVFCRYDNVLYYEFKFGDILSGTVSELFEQKMDNIEDQIKQAQEELARRHRLAALRNEVLLRLNDEEREALGLQKMW